MRTDAEFVVTERDALAALAKDDMPEFDRLTLCLAGMTDRTVLDVRAELQFRAVQRNAYGKEHTPCSCSCSCNGDQS